MKPDAQNGTEQADEPATPASYQLEDPAENPLLMLAEIGKLNLRVGVLTRALEEVLGERDALIRERDELLASREIRKKLVVPE